MLLPLSRLAPSQVSSSSASFSRQGILRNAFAAATSCLLLGIPAGAFSTRLAMSAPSGPIVVVTGSNKGIGLEILKKLAPTSSVMILAARDPGRGQAAAQKLREEGLDNVVFRPLDISSSESIHQFVAGMEKDFGLTDVLVNNAGTCHIEECGVLGWAEGVVEMLCTATSFVGTHNRSYRAFPFTLPPLSPPGIAFKNSDPTPFREQATPTLKTNFWGTVELIDAMTPLLRKAKIETPRIVNVASQSGRLSILNTDKSKQEEFSLPGLTRERLFALVNKFQDDVKGGRHKEEGWPNTCYGMSKLALISFGKVFAHEEKEGMAKRGIGGGGEGRKAIWLASCCPGWCDTDMSSHSGPRSAEQGARTPAWLASKGVEDGAKAGGFFYDEKEIPW